ncbi:MAG: hypothetical protein KDB23_20605 [Planctomycetales bacterium]|nr:hypothetical protein [Planctomycetales bacterium]
MSSNIVKVVSGWVLQAVRCAAPVRTLLIVSCLVVAGQSTTWAQADAMLDASAALSSLDTPTDDLIRLATEYSDAIRDLKIARLNLDTVQRLAGNTTITNLEVQIAGLNCEAAQRKLQILRMIVDKQIAAAEDRIIVIHELEKLGASARANQRNYELSQTETTLKILRAILAMN